MQLHCVWLEELGAGAEKNRVIASSTGGDSRWVRVQSALTSGYRRRYCFCSRFRMLA